MSQHSQRTQFGPTRALVAMTATVTGVAALATGYLTGGPWTVRQAVATALGAGLTTVLLARVLDLMAERAVIRDRAQRQARRAEQEDADRWMWQNATVGLLEAYLTGEPLDFAAEPVPEYVSTRLMDAQRQRAGLESMEMPLPPRDNDVDVTQVIEGMGAYPDDATEVIERIRD